MTRTTRLHPVLPAAAAVACLLAAAGCTVNPATGQRQLSLIGEQQEIAMGRDADRDVSASFGIYPDDALQAYVQELGARLAAASERPDLPWTFRVVDDPLVNAFALPGGYIYVTRGILAHFNSEAELVSVLGHEIGHVTARHSVEQMSQQQLAGLGLGVAAAAIEEFRPYAGLASQGLQLLFLKFSRDDERQSDDLGLRYLTRTGYDPNQMPKVFHTLDRVSEVHGGGEIPVWASTHPNPENRAGRIAQQIEALPDASQQGTVNRADYLRRLDRLVFGDDPRQGYSVGSSFYHPELEFRLVFPPGWRIINQRKAVAALNGDRNAVVVLTLASQDNAGEAASAFFEQAGIERGSSFKPGFYYFRTIPGSGQSQTLRGVVGFVDHQGRVYQLLGYTTEDLWQGYGGQLQQSVASFAGLDDRRYLDVEPKRIALVELDAATTLAEFQRRYPSTVDASEIAILNGVEANTLLARGDLVKRVIGGELPEE